MMERLATILYLKPVGEFYTTQLALDDTLCVPFEFHKSIRANFTTELDFLQYLTRQATTLIETFGDARNVRAESFTEN